MYRYTVIANEQLTPSTILLTLAENPGEKTFAFYPGQYAAISFRKHGRPTPVRCFSIVSSPTRLGVLQFSMRTKGRFTKGAAGLSAGDAVVVEGPYGGFVMDKRRDTKTVLLAGGIGITPFMSMIRYAADSQSEDGLRLLLSCATQDEVPFLDELKRLQAANQHFKVLFFIGSGPTDMLEGQHVYNGRISPEVLDEVTARAYGDKTFFICGPPGFMKGMLAMLRSKKAPRDRVITEAFSQGPNRQSGKIRSWPINIYVFGAVGMAAASVLVMVVDFFKTLPAASVASLSGNQKRSATPTSARQSDLDKLVASLPAEDSPASPSPLAASQTGSQVAVASGPAAPVSVAVGPTTGASGGVASSAAAPTASKPAAGSAAGQAAIPAPSANPTAPTPSPTPAPAPTPTPSPSPAPAPPPAPVCKTSPSGVKTCQ